MKMVQKILLMSLLCLCFSRQVFAAEVCPVIISPANDAEIIETQAQLRGGVTYLPMRALFEGCNAYVQWDGVTRIITATRLDGAVLRLDMRHNTAEITTQGKTEKLSMPQKGYIQNGRTYLPLRFVGESLHCGVIWDEYQKAVYVRQGLMTHSDKQGQSYLIDLYNGDFYSGLGAQAVRIGNCGIANSFKLADDAYSRPWTWELNMTNDGNYLLSCDYDFTGSMIHTVSFLSYINAVTEEAHFDASEDGVFYQQTGDSIYMRDKDGFLLTINDKTGTVEKLDLPKLIMEVSGEDKISKILPLAVDGDYVFLRTNYRLNLLMYNIAEKKLVNMKDVLITPEVAQSTGIQLSDDWWQKIDPYAKMIEGPYLHFIKIENGVLYAELRTYMDFVTVPLEYKYR